MAISGHVVKKVDRPEGITGRFNDVIPGGKKGKSLIQFHKFHRALNSAT